MGIEAVEVGSDGRACASGWGWRANEIGNEAGAAAVHGTGCVDGGAVQAISRCCEKRRFWTRWMDRSRAIRGRMGASGLNRSAMIKRSALTGGALGLLALEFIAPVAGQAPGLRAASESLITLLALLGALALAAQFGHTRRLRDLVLLGALVLFALVELCYGALPAALDLHSGKQFAASMQLGQLFVAAAIAAAAFTPSDTMVMRHRRPVAIVAAISLGALAAVQLGALLDAGALVIVASRPLFGIGAAFAQPLAVLVVLVTSALLACAAVRFGRRGQVERDGVMPVLAGALVLMTVARLFFLAVPALPYMWVSPAQGLWLLAAALIMAAVIRQERAVHAGLVRAAAIAERRRVARDLHDGLAQDLAFIASHGAWMAAELGADHPITVAASRALAISRGTINDLSDVRLAAPRDALEAIAHELSDRFAMSIAVDADSGAMLDSNTTEHLLRIAREAIANAGRHGRANNVLVSLGRITGGLALRIRDDGCGIRGRSASVAPEGFGIRSMRERADALGGVLTVRERDGGGTELELVLPK